jgi:Resolvase, N terminal domain
MIQAPTFRPAAGSARSTRDLLNTLAAITGRKAGFRSLADAWADTMTAHGRFMLNGWVAWRSSSGTIRARTAEGRERNAVAHRHALVGLSSDTQTSAAMSGLLRPPDNVP